MTFPYSEVGHGIHRPYIPVLMTGQKGAALRDGLLDTGSDRCILSPHVTDLIGLHAIPGRSLRIGSILGQHVDCSIAEVNFTIRRNGFELSWQAEVAIAPHRLKRMIWGCRGFLQYFRAEFDGPHRRVSLTPRQNLPRVRL